jgi:hypothetical protein
MHLQIKTLNNIPFQCHADGLRTVVFSNTNCLNILAQAEILYADGTFYTCPYLWYQVFILHASIEDVSVPLVYGLLPGMK